jgi:hypothetical protein
MNPIVSAAAVVTAIGTIGGAGIYLDHSYVASEDFGKHLSEQRVRTVFEYMDQIRQAGPEPWLCDALTQELVYLCSELPEHALCRDDASDELLEKAGC